MSYQTGAASSIADLLASIVTFATAQGWSIDHNDTAYVFTSGQPGTWISISKSGLQFNLWNDDGKLYLNTATSFSGSGTPSPDTQPGCSPTDYINNMSGAPFTGYHLFAGSTPYIHLVLEQSAGVFRHLQIGTLIKVGTWTGGAYAWGHRWDVHGPQSSTTEGSGNTSFAPWCGGSFNAIFGAVLATIDSVTQYFTADIVNPGLRIISAMRHGSFTQALTSRSPNTFNGLTPFFTIPSFLERPASHGQYSLAGYAPDIRVCSMQNLNPKDEVTLGSDTWKIFPLAGKTPPATWDVNGNGIVSSAYYGYALKK